VCFSREIPINVTRIMKLTSSTATAAAILLAVGVISSNDNSLKANAFSSRTNIQFRNSHLANVKGREQSILHSAVVAPDAELKVVKSSKTKSPKNKQRKFKKNGKKPKQPQANAKGASKRPKSKGKSKSPIKNRSSKVFRPLKDLELGSEVSGKVVDVCDFGVFVNIGYGTRGNRVGSALLHISQIQNKKIANITELYKVGDTIEGARVINVDLKKGDVGLSLRPRRKERWDFTKAKVGDVLEGKVATVVPYGVFVDVGANVNALLHISRINGGAIENVRHHLNEGDPVSAHVVDIDKAKKNLAVSMLDRKADQYLDRRMSQRLKKFYGSTASQSKMDDGEKEEEDKSTELDYFDEAIQELEAALQGRES